MTLFELLKNVPHEVVQGADVAIKHLSIDSRNIRLGTLFLCLTGFRVDGHTYIEEAKSQGTVAIVIEKDLDQMSVAEGLTVIRVANTRHAMAYIAAEFYGNPQKGLKLMGVTGTNGKTSVSFYMQAVLMAAGLSTGIIGTVDTKLNHTPVTIDFATSTTPDTIELMQIIHHMKKKGADAIAMEVTSHALALHKVEALPFEVAIFTNLTQDHLDLHGTMENYRDAKAKLYTMSKASVINMDDPYGSHMASVATGKVMGYAIDQPSDLQATEVVYRPDGVSFNVTIEGRVYPFELPIAGKFSVYNALGVMGAALLIGIAPQIIQQAFKTLAVVPGRIERVANDKGLNVIVDYAHTPDGLTNIIAAVREFTKGRVITVFGCGGDRDKDKRAKMGAISDAGSDITIITSDNPRSEEPLAILADIEAGITSHRYVKIEDRQVAIKTAIEEMTQDDTVIIAGKGHENYQIFKDQTIPFDDRVVAKTIIGELHGEA